MKLSTKSAKTISLIGCVLLLIVGVFHGSGINYINDLVQESDVSQLVKTIFPVLFILPSLQLIGLGIIGILAIRRSNYEILFALTALTLADALLAFWLGAVIPGLILAIPSIIFFVVAISFKKAASQ